MRLRRISNGAVFERSVAWEIYTISNFAVQLPNQGQITFVAIARPRKRSTAVKVERVDSDELLNVAIKAAIAKVEQRSPEFGPPFPRVPRQQRQSSLLSYVIESTLLGNARIEESVLESVIASQVSSDVTIESILAHVGEELQQRIIKSGLLHQKESKYYVDPDTFEDHEPNLLYPAPKKLKSCVFQLCQLI
jgi:hypothetical protein